MLARRAGVLFQLHHAVDVLELLAGDTAVRCVAGWVYMNGGKGYGGTMGNIHAVSERDVWMRM